jgi:hypothetical protein
LDLPDFLDFFFFFFFGAAVASSASGKAVWSGGDV